MLKKDGNIILGRQAKSRATTGNSKLKTTKHKFEIQGDEDISLDSAPGAFAQVVTNLLMNSLIHAYEPEDEGRIVFNFKQNGEHIIFEYTDDGK